MANQVSGKASSDSPALKPYRGKPAVRNFRGGNGNVGIIRSPVRAIALPDQKRQRKDDVMKEQLRHFDKPEGVVFIGKAQEKTPVFRTERRRNAETGQRYPWIVRSTAMVNHYYWYCLDQDFGPLTPSCV
jgi:hypothetical protein